MSENYSHYSYTTEMGTITIESDGAHITAVQFGACKLKGVHKTSALINECANELYEYLSGKRKKFSVPIKFTGTEFQEKVWRALQEIPYGETRSYAEIAQTLGSPNSSRAVGGANNKNPIMIIVPCHRVIATSGATLGYSAGAKIKNKLLEIEQNSHFV